MNRFISRRDILGRAMAIGAGTVLLPSIESFAGSTTEPHTEPPEVSARGIVFDADRSIHRVGAGRAEDTNILAGQQIQ